MEVNDLENRKIKVIYKQVNKKPELIEIEDTLEAKQKLVGGLIEIVEYAKDLLLICNEEGKIYGLRPNLSFEHDYIVGDCFIIGDDFENEGFKSVQDNQIEKIMNDLERRSIFNEKIEEIEEDMEEI